MNGDGDPLVYFNGLRRDGSYLQPPLAEEELVRRLLDAPPDWQLRAEPDPRGTADPTRAPRYGVDPNRLDRAGWGVVFAAGTDPGVRRALDPLLDLRHEQAARLFGETVYRPGESHDDFLARHRAPRGPADPTRLPYYLLLVGGPEEIPWSFQFGLDQVYAVGRLCFERGGDYRAYARSVVDAEERRSRRQRRVAFFAPEHAGDRATERTRAQLVAPLADHLEKRFQDHPGWSLERCLGGAAVKRELHRLLAGPRGPALVFTGGHGLAAGGAGDDDQRRWQGALITGDWSGEGGIERAHCYAAADLEADLETGAGPAGLLAFLFACYSAGTPGSDSYWRQPSAPPRLAARPFASALAQRLLAHPRGGALAVIGHVDRAWTTSFDWFLDGGQQSVYEQALECLLDGLPAGAAMEYFGQYAADLAVELCELWTQRDQQGGLADPAHFARLRLAHADARSFVVFGDPAARLAV